LFEEALIIALFVAGAEAVRFLCADDLNWQEWPSSCVDDESVSPPSQSEKSVDRVAWPEDRDELVSLSSGEPDSLE
jgi:hypothetical protein